MPRANRYWAQAANRCILPNISLLHFLQYTDLRPNLAIDYATKLNIVTQTAR
jgi:hypothetical protein